MKRRVSDRILRARFLAIMLIVSPFSSSSAGPLTVAPQGTSVDPQMIANVRRLAETGQSNLVPDRAREYLTAQGYLDATVSLRGDTIVIEPGQRYEWEEFHVRQTGLKIKPSGPFTEQSLERLTKHLLDSLEEDGYRFAQVHLEEISRCGSAITVHASIISGPCVILGSVVCEPPLARTDDSLFARYFAEYIGKPATESMVREASTVVAQIPFLHVHQPARLQPRPGYAVADLIVPVQEKPPLQAEGIIGTGAERSSPLTWRVGATGVNLFGDGRGGTIESERTATRRLLAFRFTQPLFWWGQDDLELSILSRDDRERYYEFGGEVGYGSRITRLLRVRGGLSYRTITPASSDDESYRTGRLSLSANWAANRSSAFHQSGVKWHSSATLQYRAVQFQDSQSQKQPDFLEAHLRGEFSLSLRPADRIGLFFRAGGMSFESQVAQPPVAELSVIGGAGTVRGWARESLSAIRAGYGTIEPRALFASGHLFAFYDLGYLYDRIENSAGLLRGRYRYVDGFGAGLVLHGENNGVSLTLGWTRDIPADRPRVDIGLFSQF